jgi:molecular chaperone GrpE
MMDEEKSTGPDAKAAAATETPVETAGDAGGAMPEATAAAVIEALHAEVASLRDRSLRALAESENVRRRAERDVADAKAYGASSFARDMLTVADNLRRALDSVPAEARARADGPFKALIDGIELTERDFLTGLGRHGVKQLDPLGQKFDPNLHQAMFEIPDESVPNGTVKQVMQSGFTIRDRVLRPAMVGVSKGGPKVAASSEQPQQAKGAA